MSKTLLQLRTMVRQELDLLDEAIVSDSTLTEFINEAIQIAESNIHTLYEDYFLSKTNITLVVGTADYSLPTDIFADKIRGITYTNGTLIYPITQIKGPNLFAKLAEIQTFGTTDYYQCVIRNDAASGPKLQLVPTSREAGAYVEIYYIRGAKKLSADADVCDIPEFYTFVKAYAVWKSAKLELHPLMEGYKADMTKMLEEMVETLADKVPDEDNKIRPDMSFYEDHS